MYITRDVLKCKLFTYNSSFITNNLPRVNAIRAVVRKKSNVEGLVSQTIKQKQKIICLNTKLWCFTWLYS